MYKYDSYDQAMVNTRVEEFRDQTRRRIEGTLAEENFRPLREDPVLGVGGATRHRV